MLDVDRADARRVAGVEAIAPQQEEVQRAGGRNHDGADGAVAGAQLRTCARAAGRHAHLAGGGAPVDHHVGGVTAQPQQMGLGPHREHVGRVVAQQKDAAHAVPFDDGAQGDGRTGVQARDGRDAAHVTVGAQVDVVAQPGGSAELDQVQLRGNQRPQAVPAHRPVHEQQVLVGLRERPGEVVERGIGAHDTVTKGKDLVSTPAENPT